MTWGLLWSLLLVFKYLKICRYFSVIVFYINSKLVLRYTFHNLHTTGRGFLCVCLCTWLLRRRRRYESFFVLAVDLSISFMYFYKLAYYILINVYPPPGAKTCTYKCIKFCFYGMMIISVWVIFLSEFFFLDSNIITWVLFRLIFIECVHIGLLTFTLSVFASL